MNISTDRLIPTAVSEVSSFVSNHALENLNVQENEWLPGGKPCITVSWKETGTEWEGRDSATPRIVFIQSGIVSSSNIPPSSNSAMSTYSKIVVICIAEDLSPKYMLDQF